MVHGITHDYAMKNGKKFHDVVQIFNNDLTDVDLIVAHNVNFDKYVILAEMYVAGEIDTLKKFESKRFKCTGEMSTPICNLKYGKYIKMPKLAEAYEIIVKQPIIEKLHDALNDCMYCSKIYQSIVCNENNNSDADDEKYINVPDCNIDTLSHVAKTDRVKSNVAKNDSFKSNVEKADNVKNVTNTYIVKSNVAKTDIVKNVTKTDNDKNVAKANNVKNVAKTYNVKSNVAKIDSVKLNIAKINRIKPNVAKIISVKSDGVKSDGVKPNSVKSNGDDTDNVKNVTRNSVRL